MAAYGKAALRAVELLKLRTCEGPEDAWRLAPRGCGGVRTQYVRASEKLPTWDIPWPVQQRRYRGCPRWQLHTVCEEQALRSTRS